MVYADMQMMRSMVYFRKGPGSGWRHAHPRPTDGADVDCGRVWQIIGVQTSPAPVRCNAMPATPYPARGPRQRTSSPSIARLQPAGRGSLLLRRSLRLTICDAVLDNPQVGYLFGTGLRIVLESARQESKARNRRFALCCLRYWLDLRIDRNRSR